MRFGRSHLKLFAVHYFLLSLFLPAFVSGKHEDPSFDFSPLLTPSSDESSGVNGGSGDLRLVPIDATIFALCIIFSLVTILQLLPAAFNIPRHLEFSFWRRTTSRLPHTLPIPPLSPSAITYSVGPIFPVALFMTTLCLFVTYVLRAVFWGVFYNENGDKGTFIHLNPEDYITPWAVFSYLTDTFLVMSVFSFVCFRIRRLCYCTCRTKFHLFKRIFDRILVCVLLIVGTAYVGLRARAMRSAKLHVEEMSEFEAGSTTEIGPWFIYIQEGRLQELASLRRAYDGLLVFAALDVGVTSIALYQHAGKYQSPPDRKVRKHTTITRRRFSVFHPLILVNSLLLFLMQVATHIGFVIFPLILLYTLVPLITHEILLAKQDVSGFPFGHITLVIDAGVGAVDGLKNWDLARTVITCVTMTAMIAFLLVFGGASLLDVVRRRNPSQDQFGRPLMVPVQGFGYKV